MFTVLATLVEHDRTVAILLIPLYQDRYLLAAPAFCTTVIVRASEFAHDVGRVFLNGFVVVIDLIDPSGFQVWGGFLNVLVEPWKHESRSRFCLRCGSWEPLLRHAQFCGYCIGIECNQFVAFEPKQTWRDGVRLHVSIIDVE